MISKETVPCRIVLSRKGFVSSAGGCASPILDGQMISLPITEHNLDWRTTHSAQGCAEGHLTYRDLTATPGKMVAELVAQLAKGKIRPSDCVHLDPDIRLELRKQKDVKFPLTYGQDGGSQTELSDLREGDLFLFFGWYRNAHQFSPGSYRFARDGADIHAIWGWLQIAEKLDLPSRRLKAQEIAGHHPHVSHTATRSPNCLYVARKTLTFLSDFAGAGTFPQFHEGLRLSDAQLNFRPRKRLRSNWKLPAFFRGIQLTHHNLLDWDFVDGSIFGKGGAYPGQEFVFKTDGYEKDVADWLEDIFGGECRQYS